MKEKFFLFFMVAFILFSCENGTGSNTGVQGVFEEPEKVLYVLDYVCENGLKDMPGSKVTGIVTAVNSLDSRFEVGSELVFENAIVCPRNNNNMESFESELKKYHPRCACHLFEGFSYGYNEWIEIDGISYDLIVYESNLTNDFFEINFMMNDGSNTPYKTLLNGGGVSSAIVKLRYIPYRKGYVFAGWYEDADCSGENVLIDDGFLRYQIELSENKNFYAKWIANTSGYEVGDVVLSDGLIVPYEDVFLMTDEQKESAVAVIAFVSDDGTTAYGLGLHSGEDLVWCATGSPFHKREVNDFMYLMGAKVFGSDSARRGDIRFMGDMDASDDWDFIKSIDIDGTASDSYIEANYPAWNFALTYGVKFGTGENFQDGWFIPHWLDYVRMDLNCDKVEEVLSHISGDSLYEGYPSYWTNTMGINPDDGSYYLDPIDKIPGYLVIYNPSYYKLKKEEAYSSENVEADIGDLVTTMGVNGKCNPGCCRVMRRFQKF